MRGQFTGLIRDKVVWSDVPDYAIWGIPFNAYTPNGMSTAVGLFPELPFPDAPCTYVNPDIFFPDPRNRESAKPAKAICGACPYTRECADLADESGAQTGVWGGLTIQEIRKTRRAKARGLTRRISA